MQFRQCRRVALFALVASTLCLSPPREGRASETVLAGWDLLTTKSAQFAGQDWLGVPLVTYDFGGTIGIKNVAGTDTIMRRVTDAVGVGTVMVPIELVALQLVSVNPFDPDGAGMAPLDTYYITLTAPGPGTMAIDLDPSPPPLPFSTTFQVNWGMHQGTLGGPLVDSGSFPMQTACTPYWDHVSPLPDVLLIPGVNQLLNGIDQTEDFHLAYALGGCSTGSICATHEGPSPDHLHEVCPTIIPEPSAWATLTALGLGSLALYRRTRRM